MASPSTEPIHRSEIIRTDPRTGGLRRVLYRVTVVKGPDQGTTAIVEGVLNLGTCADAGLRLSDSTISRYHLELEPQLGGVRVHDLGSRNGTFVSGARVTDAVVPRDATFLVGNTSVRVSLEEEDLGKPLHAEATFGEAVGQSHAMRELFGILARAASAEAVIVLLGETGTGKELLARAIHQGSPRAQGPFVVVDCAALSPGLFESELFGHTKGAFTDAKEDREGAFLQADGGTLFLDEVGELPIELQPKLLRVLESGTVKRVGDNQHRKVNVRVVAATHRDLEEEVAAKRFRSDLYFRLAVVVVRVPPLRERLEDIPLITRRFLEQLGRADFTLPGKLLHALTSHHWPGNVRELRNVIERGLALGEIQLSPDTKALPHASTATTEPLPFKEAKDRLVEAFTREYLTNLLQQCDRNLSKVARTAGIARSHLHDLLNRYGL